MIPLGDFIPTGLNASGQAVGNYTFSDRSSHGLVTKAHRPFNPNTDDIGDMGHQIDSFASTQAYGLNDAGQATGSSVPLDPVGFLWTPGGTDGVPGNPQMRDLGDLGSDWLGNGWSVATAINAFGDVVGYAANPLPGVAHAFLYQGGAMLDLNDLVVGAPDEYLFMAVGIADDGAILCWNYTARRPMFTAVLLKPLH